MNELGPQYVLDTNILVHFVRGSETWQSILLEYNLFFCEPTPIISVVSEGELRAIALRRGWKEKRLSQMEYILGVFKSSPLTPDVVHNYATINHVLNRRGKTIGLNDIWIASTAIANDGILLSTDRDFFRLENACFQFEWIPPIKGSV